MFAKEIGTYLQTKQLDIICMPIGEYYEIIPENTDYLLLGCWTKGLMVLFQKPDEIWKASAKKIAIPAHTRVALFATYKISTGSMFRNMARSLGNGNHLPYPDLKSRTGELNDRCKILLDEFISNHNALQS